MQESCHMTQSNKELGGSGHVTWTCQACHKPVSGEKVSTQKKKIQYPDKKG
jgi:hypothetical protein